MFKLLLSCLVLAVSAAAATGQTVSPDTRSLSADRTAQRVERTRADLQSARQAVAREDWPAAMREWQALYIDGNAEAAGQLCRLYFDARQGRFDLPLVSQSCRRAAASGDAGGRYRMGLLYLVGLGVDWNVDHARALCAEIQDTKDDPEIAGGFCMAIVVQEDAKAAYAAMRAAPAAPSSAPLDRPQSATRSLPEQCAASFAAPLARFDAIGALRSCAAAAESGDDRAMLRLGLMKLMGIGGKRDLAAAQADCTNAQTRSGGRVSGAFCLAAAAELRRNSEALAVGRTFGTVDTSPITGLALPKTEADPYRTDRLLDAPYRTDTGLEYTCRKLRDWARYEAPGLMILTARDKLFGRKIVDFRPADFAALNDAATSCIRSLASADPDGAIARDLVTFRGSLGALAERQTALRAATP